VRGRPLTQLLPGVLPDEQGPTHMDIQRADHTLLRDLHTHVQLLDEARWNPFPLVSEEERRDALPSP
jgi:hypothetical protein